MRMRRISDSGICCSWAAGQNDSGQVFATLILIACISTFTDWVLQSVRKHFFNW